MKTTSPLLLSLFLISCTSEEDLHKSNPPSASMKAKAEKFVHCNKQAAVTTEDYGNSFGCRQNGQKNGLWAKWDPDYRDYALGSYQNDKKNGFWSEFQRGRETFWKHESFVDLEWKHGTLEHTGEYKDNKRIGIWTVWLGQEDSRHKYTEGNYSDGDRVGNWQVFKPKNTVIYREGVPNFIYDRSIVLRVLDFCMFWWYVFILFVLLPIYSVVRAILLLILDTLLFPFKVILGRLNSDK